MRDDLDDSPQNVNEEDEKAKQKNAELLLQQLDARMAMSRARRESGDQRRLLFRALGLLFLVVFSLLLVWALFAYSSQLPDAPPPPAQQAE